MVLTPDPLKRDSLPTDTNCMDLRSRRPSSPMPNQTSPSATSRLKAVGLAIGTLLLAGGVLAAPAGAGNAQSCLSGVQQRLAVADWTTAKEVHGPEIIAALSEDPEIRALFARPAGVSEGYTVGQHTLMVLGSMENEYWHSRISQIKAPKGVDFFRLMKVTAGLHDIGKPLAIQAGDPTLQHQYTLPILERKLKELGFRPPEIEIARAIVGNDVLGDFMKGNITEDQARAGISALAARAGMSGSDYFRLQSFFYTIDASSYPALRNRVFEYDGTGLRPKGPRYESLAASFAPPRRPPGRVPDESWAPLANLTNDESSALTGYVHDGFRGINTWLRLPEQRRAALLEAELKRLSEGRNLEDGATYHERDREIARIDAALRKLPKFAGTTYRGLFLNPRERLEFERFIQDGQFSDPAYLSTSVEPSIAKRFTRQMRAGDPVLITVRGKNGRAVEGGLGEAEVLFERGTRFKVVSRRRVRKYGDRPAYEEIVIEEIPGLVTAPAPPGTGGP